QPTMKARRVARCLERDGVFLDARRTEIVGETADRDHQRVVRERAPRGDLFAILINDRRYLHLAPLPVEADHLSKTVAKVVPVRQSQIVRGEQQAFRLPMHRRVQMQSSERTRLGISEQRTADLVGQLWTQLPLALSAGNRGKHLRDRKLRDHQTDSTAQKRIESFA